MGSLEAYRSFIECQIRCTGKGLGEHLHEGSAPFVTLSRQTGAGGISIGRYLVAYLDEHDQKSTCPWTVIDKHLIEQVLDQHHLPREFEQYMPEKKNSEIQDIMETLFSLHPPIFALVRRTSETMLRLAQMGNVILVGRGANIVTRGLKGGFHVRLIGSLERRVHHIAEYDGLNLEEAERKIKLEDRGRRDYVKQNFGKDIEDPLLYDLTINTDRIPYDRVAELIGSEVLKSQPGVTV